jgi:hypothetical protein
MDAYIFGAALYCPECAESIMQNMQGAEDTGDSNDYPQGPFPNGGGEADSPQHCDSGPDCLAAENIGGRRVGAFLQNPLTSDGEAYVRQALKENQKNPVARFWAQQYGLERRRTHAR